MRRREGHDRRQRALPASRHRGDARRRRQRTRRSRWRASAASPTSSSTARSGILGNGAGLVMSTLDVVDQAGGSPANFLDVGGGAEAEEIVDGARGASSPTTKVRAILFNIFGGITRCDEVAKRHPRRRSTSSTSRCRSWCGWTAPTTTRAASCWPTRRPPNAAPRDDDARRGAQRSSSSQERPPDGDSRRPRTRGSSCRASPGREGSFHALRNRDYGTKVVAGVTPGKGGQDVEGVPVFDTVAEAVARDGREHRDGVRAAARSPPTRSSRPPTRACETDHLHPEGIPAHEMLDVYTYVASPRRPPARPELPGRALARAGRTSGSSRRTSSRRAASGWSRAPARSPTRSATSWPSSASATRRSSASAATRSSAAQLHRRARAVRGRRPDRADRDGRRDRRRRGGEGGRLHRRARDEAGGRLHRRLHGAARQDDGPRRRDHLRLRRARRRPRRRRSRRAASRSARNPTEAASLAADGCARSSLSRPRESQPIVARPGGVISCWVR